MQFLHEIFQGLHGDDLDVVFILCEEKSTKNRTELDQKLLQLKYDPLALNAHLLELLQRQILNDFHAEIIDCRKIDALYPIISIIFTDQTRVEIFIQPIFNDQNDKKKNLLSNFYQPLHGVRTTMHAWNNNGDLSFFFRFMILND